MAITSEQFEAAVSRGKATQEAAGRAVEATYDHRKGLVVIKMASGVELRFPPGLAEGLAGASAAELREVQISPSGLGLHWPSLDADLYVPALFQFCLGSKLWTRSMAASLGRTGGRQRSKAKSKAARKNGQLGGRPRKKAANAGV